MNDAPDIETLARQFAKKHRETIRYSSEIKRFKINLGAAWLPDEGFAVFNTVVAFLRKRNPQRGCCAGTVNAVYARLKVVMAGPPEGAA